MRRVRRERRVRIVHGGGVCGGEGDEEEVVILWCGVCGCVGVCVCGECGVGSGWLGRGG